MTTTTQCEICEKTIARKSAYLLCLLNETELVVCVVCQMALRAVHKPAVMAGKISDLLDEFGIDTRL